MAELAGASGTSQDAMGGNEDAKVVERIQTFLGEFRILVPALGAVFGFQLTSAFSNGWNQLSDGERFLNLGATCSTAIAICVLLLPANYQRVTPRPPADEDFLHFAQRCFGLTFLFAGIGIVGSLVLQLRRVTDNPLATVGFAVVLVVFFFVMWSIIPSARARKHEGHDDRRSRANSREAAGSGGK